MFIFICDSFKKFPKTELKPIKEIMQVTLKDGGWSNTTNIFAFHIKNSKGWIYHLADTECSIFNIKLVYFIGERSFEVYKLVASDQHFHSNFPTEWLIFTDGPACNTSQVSDNYLPPIVDRCSERQMTDIPNLINTPMNMSVSDMSSPYVNIATRPVLSMIQMHVKELPQTGSWRTDRLAGWLTKWMPR